MDPEQALGNAMAAIKNDSLKTWLFELVTATGDIRLDNPFLNNVSVIRTNDPLPLAEGTTAFGIGGIMTDCNDVHWWLMIDAIRMLPIREDVTVYIANGTLDRHGGKFSVMFVVQTRNNGILHVRALPTFAQLPFGDMVTTDRNTWIDEIPGKG